MTWLNLDSISRVELLNIMKIGGNRRSNKDSKIFMYILFHLDLPDFSCNNVDFLLNFVKGVSYFTCEEGKSMEKICHDKYHMVNLVNHTNNQCK